VKTNALPVTTGPDQPKAMMRATARTVKLTKINQSSKSSLAKTHKALSEAEMATEEDMASKECRTETNRDLPAVVMVKTNTL
jgi:predicted RNA polymerase sigma factor